MYTQSWLSPEARISLGRLQTGFREFQSFKGVFRRLPDQRRSFRHIPWLRIANTRGEAALLDFAKEGNGARTQERQLCLEERKSPVKEQPAHERRSRHASLCLQVSHADHAIPRDEARCMTITGSSASFPAYATVE